MNIPSPQAAILAMLSTRLGPAELAWLETGATRLRKEPIDNSVFTLFSSALRYSGKGPLSPDPRELDAASSLVPGWDPVDWTLDQAARIYLLLAMPPTPESARRMDSLLQTADLGEALALHKALPLLPNPLEHLSRAREGARNNAKSIFEAVALRNPYPAAHFDEPAWNQLVSKAVFVDSPLDRIYGLDKRANKRLNRILIDLVAERQAAGRPFTPLLYRCLWPCAGQQELDLIESALKTASRSDADSILAGLSLSEFPGAARILDRSGFKPEDAP